MEHHHSIVLLCENKLYGSAFALLRSVWEGYVRGEWLWLCATDAEVEDFSKAIEPPSIGVMIKQLEMKPGHSQGVLSTIKDKHWGAMCAYTHTGGLHVQRWQSPEGVEPNYDHTEVDELLRFAEVFASAAAVTVASMCKGDAVVERIALGLDKRVQSVGAPGLSS
jgi:hypothetical protein